MTRCEFGLCDGSGFLVDEATRESTDCRCRPLRLAAVRARRLKARIPNLYREISFSQTDVIDMERRFPTQVRELRAYVRDIDANIDSGRSLWLAGDPGTGKTALAMIVSKTAIDAGRTVAIYSCPQLLGVIRESIDTGGVLDFLERLTEVDLLQIDDLGAEHRTDWVLEQLYSIINARYAERRATIFTTNLSRDELSTQIGERIVSRLEGMCGDPIPFYGHDARRVTYPLPATPA
ncbi:MAG: replication protein DnaC [Gaiellaceae bacterium]|nr:replication protein DnaC [Gaiellaceae bacterium]